MPAQTLEYAQIANIVNDIGKQEIGESASIVNEDLSNICDFGTDAANAGKVDRILDEMVARITRMVTYDRSYKVRTDFGILRDQVEYGVIQRLALNDLIPAEDNISYKLENGMSVDPFQIKNLQKPTAKYFEQKATESIDVTILRQQYKLVFTNAENLARFVGMIFTMVENSKAVYVNGLIKGIMRAAMSEAIYQNKAVNLISLYNTEMGLTGSDVMTVAKAKYSKDFLRFMSMKLNDYITAIKEMSTLYNIDGAARFTPEPKIAMLGQVADTCQYYLESDTFHKNLVELPNQGFVKVDHWQINKSRAFSDLSSIDVTNAAGHHVQQSGIVACIYDPDSMMVALDDPRTTSAWNPAGEYITYFNKYDWMSCFFTDQNIIPFILADA